MNGSGIFGGHIFEGFGQAPSDPAASDAVAKIGQSTKTPSMPSGQAFLPGVGPAAPFEPATFAPAAPAQDNTAIYVGGAVALAAVLGVAWMMTSSGRKVTANSRRRGRRSRSRRGH